MNRTHGFTIVELMVIMGILAVTVAFGIPQINNVVMDNRKVDALNRLSANMAFARSEAIKRGSPVALTVGNRAPNWEQGWSVFADDNNNGLIDPGETVLRIEDNLNLPPTATITCNCTVTYNADGSNNAGADVNLTLNDTKLMARTVLTINAIGRVSIGKLVHY